ncbi:MAG: hypothetical protein ACKVU1_04460 [bacterium]
MTPLLGKVLHDFTTWGYFTQAVFGLVVLASLRLWWYFATRKLPTTEEWRRIADGITGLDRAGLSEWKLSAPTRQALSVVVTERAGIGRRRESSHALDVLESAFHHSVRMQRAFSGLAVMLGLLSTVFFFSNVISSLEGLYSSPSALDGRMDWSQFGHTLTPLKWVYLVNTFCIALAIIFLLGSLGIGRRGRDTLHQASEALARFQDDAGDHFDPRLKAAIDSLLDGQDRRTEELLSRHLRGVTDIVTEVRNLSGGIERVVEDLTKQAKSGPDVVLGPVRQVQATLEALLQRLDEGFTALAQPFTAGIPAMRELSASAESLKEASMRLEKSDVLTAVGALQDTAVELRKTANALSTSVETSLIRYGENASKAVEIGLSRGVQDSVVGLRNAITDGTADSHRTLALSLDRLQANIESFTKALQDDKDSLPSRVGQGVAVALGPDYRSLLQSVQMLSDSAREATATGTRIQHAAEELTKKLEVLQKKADPPRRRSWFPRN